MRGECILGVVFLVLSLISNLFAQETIIDNGDTEYSQIGFETIDDTKSYQGDVAVASKPTANSSAQFSTDLNGMFDVYLYWGDYPDKDTDVRWTVHHAKGATTHSFTQRNSPGWHFHGTYQLNGKSNIVLQGRKIADAGMVADAVKFVPTARRVVRRTAKYTITPITLNYGDALHFQLRNGQTRKLELIGTSAEMLIRDDEHRAKYKFGAVISIDDNRFVLERIVPAQESFYEPLVANGIRIWLDAVSDIFVDDGGFMVEKDIKTGISCRPKRKARLVVNDQSQRICPEKIAWWYPEDKDHLDVRQCYRGEDVWMGPYKGERAHGGLDINMKSGTPLYAPINFDDHFLFDSLKAGDDNNRWRGIRRWDNGAIWWLQAHHINKLVLPEHIPLERGEKYAETAGVRYGVTQHTHFVFRVFEEGESYWIDPWILFWQTFADNPRKPNRLEAGDETKRSAD